MENRGILPSFFFPPFFILLRKRHVFIALNAECFILETNHYPFPFSADTTNLFPNKVFQKFPDKHSFLLIQGEPGELPLYPRYRWFFLTFHKLLIFSVFFYFSTFYFFYETNEYWYCSSFLLQFLQINRSPPTSEPQMKHRFLFLLNFSLKLFTLYPLPFHPRIWR